MGRKLGFFDHLMRDIERSSQRSASDSRRRAHRVEGMQDRAYEREFVRQERARERAQVQGARAAERARVAAERADVKRTKEEAKEAQLAEWRQEVAEHQERDRELLSIANDGPEVEDRVELFRDLLSPNQFTPPPFTAPPAQVADFAPTYAAERMRLAQVDQDVLLFVPNLERFRSPIVVCGTITVAGIVATGVGILAGASGPMLIGEGVAAVGLLAVVAIAVIRWVSGDKERKTVRTSRISEVQAETRRQLEKAVVAATAATERHAQDARRRYEADVATADAAFRRSESQRIDVVQRILAGEPHAIAEALERLLPLDLPTLTKCKFKVSHGSEGTVVDLDVELPEASALPVAEAKLLASGKVAYKDKSPKRLVAEYARLIAGIGMRYASEVMLQAPTCNVVRLRGWRTTIDPSRGTPARGVALDVTYNYATLAPMTMDDIDPVAALKHFKGTITMEA